MNRSLVLQLGRHGRTVQRGPGERQRRSGHLSPGLQRLRAKPVSACFERLLRAEDKQSEEPESDEDEQGPKLGPGGRHEVISYSCAFLCQPCVYREDDEPPLKMMRGGACELVWVSYSRALEPSLMRFHPQLPQQ